MGLQSMLERVVREGDLTIRLPGGGSVRLGDGSGPPLIAAVTSAGWAARMATNPGLAVGEAYMDGGLVLEQGDIADFVDIIGRNSKYTKRPKSAFERWFKAVRHQMNARGASRRNVAHHYDLSDELYRSFLDEDMQYSCAYFARPDMTLEEAQVAKKRHIAAKLRLQPGQTVLDIGCGWGGLGLTLAEEAGVDVHGITLSVEQLEVAKARAEARGLAGRVRFSLTDYRDVTETYDRIVSVGMFEHVGRPNYQTYFDSVARLLKDDGVALIHTIGRRHPGTTSNWIDKYIFPGGHAPPLSEVAPAIERAGFYLTDLEILRRHYAETLRHWRQRFAANRARIAEIYDERFCRMWEFYLGVSEMSFRHRSQVVFQLQLSKQIDTVPITRDYIAETEAAMAKPATRVA